MTTEHLPPGQPGPSKESAVPEDAARRALRVTLLTTEHWSLLATRSLSWNESFARAGMFLTVLTGAVVALALVAQATNFGSAFTIFALLLLPVVFFVGSSTLVRLNEINQEDLQWVRGMNRLRRAYLEIDPGIEPYLITGWTEDVVGVLRTFGAPGGSGLQAPSIRGNIMHAFVTTPMMILIVNCVVGAVLVGLVVAQLGMTMELAAIAAVAAFVLIFTAFAAYGYRKASFFTGSGSRQPGE
ncbi:MAG TPA: hypothetical protein VFP83_04510 [Candidatus Limnocylindria bacterium]|nr:hypothetical protein [Candidatus Limnocylindria bacterium]